VAVVAACLLTLVPSLAAQVEEPNPLQMDAPRPELVGLLDRLEKAANSPAYSEHLRAETRVKAAGLRERLEEGDFRIGDRILLLVENQPTFSDTFAVGGGQVLTLPQIGAVPLRGVLRGELEDYVGEYLSRFLREPSVRAHPLVRVAITGGIGRPGFHTVPSDVPITEVIMMVGGPSPTAEMEKIRIDRGERTVWEPGQMRQAVLDGRTLGELNVQSGDLIVVPTRREMTPERAVRTFTMLVGIPITIAALVALFR
jgi:protein involved in polysaccharide export with SLBB domain